MSTPEDDGLPRFLDVSTLLMVYAFEVDAIEAINDSGGLKPMVMLTVDACPPEQLDEWLVLRGESSDTELVPGNACRKRYLLPYGAAAEMIEQLSATVARAN
jgi:hypothetical protein